MKKLMMIGILLAAVILSCSEKDAARDVSGFYKMVKCEVPADPPLKGLEITKMKGNNFYASLVEGDGKKLKQRIVFGLNGKNMEFNGVPLVQFLDDNFTTLYHQPSRCTYKK